MPSLNITTDKIVYTLLFRVLEVRGRQQTEEGNDKVNGGPIQNFTDSDVK
jgi:hypothetical protein